MFRRSLLVSVAVSCLVAAGSAIAAPAAPSAGLSEIDNPITQFYGSINPFYGSIDPFYGSINPFYGSISPFYGSINPFYGNISPFWGDNTQFWGTINPFYGSINPFYGSINPFYGSINPFWGTINPFSTNTLWAQSEPFWQAAGPQWGAVNASWANLQAANTTNYSSVQLQLQNFITSAQNFWGSAVQKATGKNFMDGFATPLFAHYGIDPSSPSSLASVSAQTRSAFFLAWYDGLMSFTGVDHVDWWMGAVHWTPQLTQIENAGTNSIVGVLDSSFSSNNSDVANLKFVGGYSMYVNDHGAAVASLIAAQQDGQGVMGIAPNSSVLLYNPFDQTGTASWADVTAGINMLYASGAGVINASLGVPGSVLSSEWASILTAPSVNQHKESLVLVKAAGNEGVAQSTDINWIGNTGPTNLLLVGSVGPDGNISSFSNTPGNACILVNSTCDEQNKLMYHFLVAPGENILVSDNHGGVTRMSGTSFAAPLVTGAVALLQDRWPWLQQHADETVQIILQSATDLGAPGVDPVYGWGELNIEASQSPLNFDNLVMYEPSGAKNAPPAPPPPPPAPGTTHLPNIPGYTQVSAASLKTSLLNPGQLNLWQQQGASVVAFEAIGTTYRDFEIPLSTLLVGANFHAGSIKNSYQTYLYDRLISWANQPGAANFSSPVVPFKAGDWDVSLMASSATADEVQNGESLYRAEIGASNATLGLGVRLGIGDGAHAFVSDSIFAMRSDFDSATGGVNPVAGFASGGLYAQGSLLIGHSAHLNIGFTQKTDDHTYVDPTFGAVKTSPLARSDSSASVIGVDYAIFPGFTVNTSFTRLDEANGLLGSQGSGLFSMSEGAQTTATTAGAMAALGGGWSVAGSATTAQSSTPQFATSALSFSRNDLTSTAYELVATKLGVFDAFDQIRVSFTQPLHIQSGTIKYQSLQVADRSTGELGADSQSWNLGGAREYRMESLYSAPILDGKAQVQAFGVVDLNPPSTGARPIPLELSVGAQFHVDL